MAFTRNMRGFSTQPRPGTPNIRQDNWKLYDYQLVKRDLLNHFFTRKGERVMLPEYGSIIWDMVMEPLTDYNKDRIVEDVIRIIKSEPRVALQNLSVQEFQHGLKINVSLIYLPNNSVEVLSAEFDRRAAERS